MSWDTYFLHGVGDHGACRRSLSGGGGVFYGACVTGYKVDDARDNWRDRLQEGHCESVIEGGRAVQRLPPSVVVS